MGKSIQSAAYFSRSIGKFHCITTKVLNLVIYTMHSLNQQVPWRESTLTNHFTTNLHSSGGSSTFSSLRTRGFNCNAFIFFSFNYRILIIDRTVFANEDELHKAKELVQQYRWAVISWLSVKLILASPNVVESFCLRCDSPIRDFLDFLRPRHRPMNFVPETHPKQSETSRRLNLDRVKSSMVWFCFRFFRLKQEPAGTTQEQVIYAKKLYESAFHPDSGDLQNVFGRMSFQVPGGMAITGAMLQFYKFVQPFLELSTEF